MCIKCSVATLQEAVITKIYDAGIHIGLVNQAPDQTNNIDKYKIEKYTIHPDLKLPDRQFPDLAILKLTKDIANSEDAM